jgi:hypothetical protein
VGVYNNQMHVCYRDAGFLIQDAWYDGQGGVWRLQQLTGGGGTAGGPAAAAGDPAVGVYNNQMHVCYRDAGDLIQDAWYDGQGTWRLQQLIGQGGNTSGPLAIGDLVIALYDGQLHVCYRDARSLIQDAWFLGAPY